MTPQKYNQQTQTWETSQRKDLVSSMNVASEGEGKKNPGSRLD